MICMNETANILYKSQFWENRDKLFRLKSVLFTTLGDWLIKQENLIEVEVSNWQYKMYDFP